MSESGLVRWFGRPKRVPVSVHRLGHDRMLEFVAFESYFLFPLATRRSSNFEEEHSYEQCQTYQKNIARYDWQKHLQQRYDECCPFQVLCSKYVTPNELSLSLLCSFYLNDLRSRKDTLNGIFLFQIKEFSWFFSFFFLIYSQADAILKLPCSFNFEIASSDNLTW